LVSNNDQKIDVICPNTNIEKKIEKLKEKAAEAPEVHVLPQEQLSD